MNTQDLYCNPRLTFMTNTTMIRFISVSVIAFLAIASACTRAKNNTNSYTCICAWSRKGITDTATFFYYIGITKDSAQFSCHAKDAWLSAIPGLSGTDSCQLK